MKKILVTALALSFAAVSMLDARPVRKGSRRGRGRTVSTPVNPKELAQKAADMNAAKDAGNIGQAAKMAAQIQKDVAKDPQAAELENLYKQIKAQEDKIGRLKADRDALKVSWFGSWTDSDYKSKSAEIKEAEAKLRQLRTDANKIIGDVGMDTARTIKIVALGTTAVALAAGIADWYFELGYGKAGYAKAGEYVETVGGWVTSGKEKVVAGWNRLRGNKVEVAADAAGNAAGAAAAAAGAATDAAKAAGDAAGAAAAAAGAATDAAKAAGDAAGAAGNAAGAAGDAAGAAGAAAGVVNS